jgi:hypothetical protein
MAYKFENLPVTYPILRESQIDNFIRHPDYHVRCSIASHPNLSESQIDKLVNDVDIDVRCAIASHPRYVK